MSFRETQCFYQVGERRFIWLYERPEQISPGYSGKTRPVALQEARALAEQTGQPIELRARERMNDYVGSPIWGNERLLQLVPLKERRQRLSPLAA